MIQNTGRYANLQMGLLALQNGKIHLGILETTEIIWYDSKINKIVTSSADCLFFANY